MTDGKRARPSRSCRRRSRGRAPASEGDLALGLPYDETSRSPPATAPTAGAWPTGWPRGTCPSPTTCRRAKTRSRGIAVRSRRRPEAPVKDAARPFPTASAALVYDPATGIFDVSLAAAWAIGRAHRAGRPGVQRSSWSGSARSVHRLVDLDGRRASQSAAPRHLARQPRRRSPRAGLIEKRFLEQLKVGLAERGRKRCREAGGAGRAPPTGARRPQPEVGPVDAVKELLERGRRAQTP